MITVDTLAAIALLCQVHPAGGSWPITIEVVKAYQLQCQKDLIYCLVNKNSNGHKLSECILEKK